ncbi:putative ankyrin repeat and zinc finger domain protein [Trypanosoma theileri]|uniref:Putative ankyrin repeat and zinc finger domain protein n=1 Tax=Trypanosoma theileri TaxID=67003 RepID=A0A1X0P4S2_9TRYP|nr:putative ankyrin repeat and zinc finger domain protein [Trypanosoma theileri]ORC91944.1 putative ankyrin repeat and zinc finger domain protein [Trypanosoma theileri]
MSSLDEIQQLIKATRISLATPPRNAYEAENTYNANIERLRDGRQKLGNFSGEYVEKLLHELDKLEQEVHASVIKQTNPVDALLQVDFTAEEGENEDGIDEELITAEREVGKKLESKKKQGGRKTKTKTKKQSKTGDSQKESVLAKEEEKEGKKGEKAVVSTVSPQKQLEPLQSEEADEGEVVEVAKFTDCNSNEIPQEAVGPGRCVLIPNTPLARLDFTSPVEYDGILCQCRVTLHRAVVTALSYGTPVTETVKMVPEDNLTSIDTANDENLYSSDLTIEAKGEEEEEEEMEKEEKEKGSESDEDSVTAELSKQLIAEYDAMQDEKEEEDGGTKLLPQDVPPKLCTSLRSFTFLPWVILMCHGGYFAGGVFMDGKPVVHKSFQRYVVRKKQGGKQSSHEKDSGSYGSIGSQIRRAQEIKWRLDVRDILLRWRPYIDAAALVLYVAPGPQNRAVLTDFSQLPPLPGRPVSPVGLRDPRVRRAPLTTHKPSFQEVQRTYQLLSTCTVEYIRSLK